MYEYMNSYEFMTCRRSNIVCKLECTFGIPTYLSNFFVFIIWPIFGKPSPALIREGAMSSLHALVSFFSS